MQLLERTSDGPKLTRAGETLAGHADAVIARLDEAERELAEIAGLEGGRMRLISFPSASATLVTRAMSEFRARFPGIELQFAEGEPEESIPALKRGEFDIALGFDYPVVPAGFRPRPRGGADLRGPDAGRAGAGAPPRRVRDGRAHRPRRRGLALRAHRRAPAAST